MKPFRWNVHKVEQLGRMVDPSAPGPRPWWVAAVVDAAVKVVARSGGADLVFVGRSPENFFDYLSGVFATTSFAERIHHLNISNRFVPIDQIRRRSPKAYRGLCAHVNELGLDPASIVGSREGVCFVDLVATGSTFGQLTDFLVGWANDTDVVTKQLIAKMHFVGLTWRAKSSPNAYRWQQHAGWVKAYGVTTIKNVSIEPWLADQLGAELPKVTPPNAPEHWPADAALGLVRTEDTMAALQLAYSLYQLGVCPAA